MTAQEQRAFMDQCIVELWKLAIAQNEAQERLGRLIDLLHAERFEHKAVKTDKPRLVRVK